MSISFPALRVLHLDNTVFKQNRGEATSQRAEYDTWFTAVKILCDGYKGLCELEFGNGSFFQVKGSLDGGYASFSPRHDPAVTALLKKPALKFLTAVSRSLNTGPEIEE
jgi:hypothetical protein